MDPEDRELFRESQKIERGMQLNLMELRQIAKQQCVQADRVEEKINSLNTFTKVAAAVAGVIMAITGIFAGFKW